MSGIYGVYHAQNISSDLRGKRFQLFDGFTHFLDLFACEFTNFWWLGKTKNPSDLLGIF
jgi:hypothetical protein